jgi:hypothetical protein
MKYKLLLVLSILFCTTLVSSQNILINSINANKSERTGSDGDTYSEFNAVETGNCSFEFNVKKYIDYVMDYTILYQKYTWNWKDITYMSMGENMLQLSADGSKIALNSKDKETGNITPSNEQFVTLYFNSQDETKSAASWIVDRVKSCGGNLLYK